LSAYLPTTAAVVFSMAVLLVGTLLAGLICARVPGRATARAAAWALVLVSVVAISLSPFVFLGCRPLRRPTLEVTIP